MSNDQGDTLMDSPPMIYKQLSLVMTAVGAVGKNKRNLQQGYQFRAVDDVMAALQPLMAEHGIICIQRVIEREREVAGKTKSGIDIISVRLLVEHVFYASDGSSVTCTTLGEAADMSDKASNKAMSAALKYALTCTYMIPTYEVDRDTEEASPEVVQVDVMAKGQPPVGTKRVDLPGVATARGPEFDQFMVVSSLLQQVWPGIDGANDRLKWWKDRFFKRDESIPEDFNPGKAFMACEAKRRAELQTTAKKLVDSETPPSDRT